MGQAFYRKYRSKTFDEVVGQEHIVRVLKNSLKSGHISHAYLLTGPRGVGKTSVARILAREVNGLKPDDQAFYTDIIEIDAASNRRIEEMRELRDKIEISPSALKYKVYIIDEVHMLTKETFNALLKTLEEPPAHVIFILATTDFHKVPDTIISRCIRLNFKLIEQKELIKQLKFIASAEKINIDEPALLQISHHSEGSLRDAISLLDQLSSSGGKVSDELVQAVLGTASQDSIDKLLSSLKTQDIKQIFAFVQELIDQGATIDQMIRQISAALRSGLIGETALKIDHQDALSLIDNLATVMSYQDQRLGLELALSKIVIKNAPIAKKEELSVKEVKPEPLSEISFEPSQTAPEPLLKPTEEVNLPGAENFESLWDEILNKLKDQNFALYGIARMAVPKYNDGSIILNFKFPFHHKQMNLDKNKSIVLKLAKENDKTIKTIELELGQDSDDKTLKFDKSQSDQTIANISNIFGSAELLE